MMPGSKISKPKFTNEAEEADWYAANPDYILQQLELAEAEGRLGHGTAAKRLGLKSSIPTTILLTQDDLDLASAQAQTLGVDLHVYFKSLVHDALHNIERR